MKVSFTLFAFLASASLACDSSLCPVAWRGDGVCDLSCMSSDCGFDSVYGQPFNSSSDCFQTCLSLGCSVALLENEVCDAVCESQVCAWDMDTCVIQMLDECGKGCFSHMIGDGMCDAACLNTACSYDGGDCVKTFSRDKRLTQETCAPGCTSDMIGNIVCDQVCNSEACGWDGLDCGCAPNCQTSDYGKCKAECLVPDCNYDNISPNVQCQDEGLRQAALYYQLAVENFTVPYSYSSTCALNVSSCGSAQWTAAQTNCVSACNQIECAFSFGNCLNGSPCKPPRNCVTCGLSNGQGCLSCIPGTYHFYRSCVIACPAGFHVHPLVSDLCYPNIDNTTPGNPQTYYVTFADNPGGMGTYNNPFDSVSMALAACVFHYCQIFLLKGNHILTLLNPSPILQTWYQGVDFQSSVSSQHQLVVKGFTCEMDTNSPPNPECATSNPTLIFDNLNPVQLTISGNVSISGVNLSGKSTLMSGCSTEKCMYCGVMSVAADGTGTDDQGFVHSPGSFVTSSACSGFMYFSLMILQPDASLLLCNLTISDFRQGLGSLFTMTSGLLTLESVILVNISTSSVPSISYYSFYSVTNAIIQQNCTNPIGINMLGTTYASGEILLSNVTASLLNNGYELTPGLIQYGLLSVNGIQSVRIVNSTFTNIIVQNGGFLSVFCFLTFSIDNCVFDTIYVEGMMIKLAPTGLMTLTPGPDNEPDEYYLDHISITNTAFTRVSTSNARNFFLPTVVIYVLIWGHGMNMRIENVGFSRSSSSQYMVFLHHYATTLAPGEMEDSTVGYDTGTTNITMTVPKIWTRLESVTVDSTFAGLTLFVFNFLTNLEINKLALQNSGDTNEHIGANVITLSHLIGKPGVYLTHMLSGDVLSSCMCTVNIQSSYNVNILNSVFANNTCSSPVTEFSLMSDVMVSVTYTGQGGIQTAALSGNFNMTNVEMINLTGPSVTGGTALVLTTSGLITLTNVNVVHCVNTGSTVNGIVSINPTSAMGVYLTGCNFAENLSQGAALQVHGGSALTIAGCTFASNKSKSQTAVYFLPGASFSSAQVTITASQFLFNSGRDGTAVYLTNIALNPITLTVQISSTVFLSNSGTGSGTAIWIDNKNALEGVNFLKNCTFINNSANDGVVNVAFLSGSLSIEDCTFVNNTGQTVAGISASQQPNTPTTPTFLSISTSYFSGNSGGSLIKLQNPNGFEQLFSFSNRFQNNQIIIFDVESSIVKDEESIYESNAGTSIYATSLSEITVLNSIFVNGTAKIGGAVYLGRESALNCTNCTFMHNAAITSGGAVYVEQDSVLTVRNSQFIRNFAGFRGSAVYIFGASANSSFRNTLFLENESGDSATVAAISSSTRFLNCTFLRNKATKTALISAYFSSTFLANSTISEHWNLSSPLIYSALESNLHITGCNFTGVETSGSGGVVYALNSQLVIASSTFSAIRAYNGALILVEAGSEFWISGSSMTNVTATDSFGGIIFAIAGSGQIVQTSFQTYNNSAIIGTSMTSLILSEVTFLGKSYSDGSGATGGALYCSGCTTISVTRSIFNSISAVTGAAVYLTTSTQNMAATFSTFISCTFYNLTSSEAAVYIYNGNAAFQQCNFEHCRALGSSDGIEGNGGAMSLYCPDLPGGCMVSIDSCEFVNNSAAVQGGSIYWQDSKPVIANISFVSGSALYGPDIASYPVEIHISGIDGNATTKKNSSIGNFTSESEGVLLNLASGQIAEQTIIATLLDQYGQIVLTNTGTYVSIGTNAANTSVLGTTTFPVVNGTFTLKGFGVTAQPETTTTIYIRTNAIDFGKEANARDNISYSDTAQLSAVMRACQTGESLFGIQCVVCPPGKYSLNPAHSCIDCAEGAICHGSDELVPKAGYWRSSVNTDKFYACPDSQSCTGSPEPPETLVRTGRCAPGYYGNLCNGCLPGFSRQNQVECSPCPSTLVNAIKISGIAVMILAFLILVVATAIRSARTSQSHLSIYIKILLNYLQLVTLTANFNLNWPSYMLQLFTVQITAGSATDQVFSLDCMFPDPTLDAQGNAIRRKIVILSVLPASLFAASLMIWLSVSILKGKYAHLKNEMVTTCVVCFFLVHPSIVKFMFDFLHCRQLDLGEYWMSSYLNIRCWDGVHYKYALAVALPSILVWGVGLPAICLIYLMSHSKHLDKYAMRLRFGFIYHKYERKQFFWEFVIIYRKVLIITIAVFLSNGSIFVQALTAMLVILIALSLQSMKMPYTVPAMNKLELRGIFVSGVTMYCGLYYLSQGLDPGIQVTLFVVIITSNAYFLLYWTIRVLIASSKLLQEKCPWVGRLFAGMKYQHRNQVANSPLSQFSRLNRNTSFDFTNMPLNRSSAARGRHMSLFVPVNSFLEDDPTVKVQDTPLEDGEFSSGLREAGSRLSFVEGN